MASRARLGTGKVLSADEAVRLIPDGATLTISGTIGWLYPAKLLQALEVRFLTEGHPRDLTWFDPFPTGVPGIEPLAHEGLLRRVIGGWFTPHPRLQAMILNDEIEAYMYPLGTLSFWLQSMAAGREFYLTNVGLGTYVDPRQGGGRLNRRTTEELVTLEIVAGEEYLRYRKLPIHVALLRGSVVDEEGNLSLDGETVTMNSLYQAIAAKRFGGVVIAQAKRLVESGSIPPRLVAVPGVPVDAVVIAPDQHRDEASPDLEWLVPDLRLPRPPAFVLASPSKLVWREWFESRRADTSSGGEAGTLERLLAAGGTADRIVARRAVMELRPGSLVNVGTGLPTRDLIPAAIEEGLDACCELSIETGVLGGYLNGAGFRSNMRAVLDTPAIFSIYASGIPEATFLSMLEFDQEGNVNLLRYGDVLVGPGGSMDIAEAVETVVFCGPFRAGGLQVEAANGNLRIITEGKFPRGVERVQAVCFSGPKMRRQGKRVLYVTERAVFELTDRGVALREVAPGIDVEGEVLGRMAFRPYVDGSVATMDERIFRAGPMGLLAGKPAAAPGPVRR